MWHLALGLAHIARKDYASAARQTEALLDLDATFWWGHHLRGVLAVIHGRYREAAGHFAEAVRCSGGAPYAVGLQACALGLAGDSEAARRELEGLREAAKTRHVPALPVALAYAGLGQLDDAFEFLTRSFGESGIWLISEVLYLRQLDALRGDPRMADLRRQLAARGVRIDAA